MEYDYLLACGDSFTEGCQEIIGKGPQGTWPGIVAEHFNIPFSNIARGGASNTEIAWQPLQSNIPEFAKAKRPLIIFGLTVSYRLPYINPSTGVIDTQYSILPEHMKDGWPRHLRAFATEMLYTYYPNLRRPIFLKHQLGVSISNSDHIDHDVIDSFLFATQQSIKIMMQYKIINPNAEVMWGWIHNTANNSRIDEKILLPYRDNCFNKHLDWLPLQHFTDADSEKYWLDEDDCHPNEKGIQLYADFFINLLENNNGL